MTWFKVDDKLHGHPQRAAGREMGQLDLIELPRGPHHVGTDDTVRVGDPQHVTCLGDSGGPALIMEGGAEIVIGVDSYADNGSCNLPAHFRRTDLYTGFLDPYLGTAANPDAGVDAGVGADAGVDPGDDSGGCAAGGGAGAGGALVVAIGLALVRRRRR